MTQSVFFSQGLPIASTLFVVLMVATVLFILVLVVPKYSEDEKPRRKQREYKPTRQEKLMNACIGIIMLCLIIIILIWVLVVIGNNLIQATINCANCTVALNG